MHRRVAHTVAAVIPRTYSTDRLTRLQDPARVAVEENDYYGTEDVYVPPEESSDVAGYDLTTHDEGQQHWRRLDSRGDSILSGLDGPGEEEQDRMRGSPESMQRGGPLHRVAEEDILPASTDPDNRQLGPEDMEEAIEWELEENGLYKGSYTRLLALYTLVPLSALITFGVLAVLPLLVWPYPSSPSRYPPLFPSPLPEFLLSAAMSALAYQLRVPFYMASSLLLRPDIASLLATLLHVLLVNALRLASLALLQVRHNMDGVKPTWQSPSFHTVWWLSFNIADILVSLVRGYQQIVLYRDVLVPPGREREFLERLKDRTTPLHSNGDLHAWQSSPEPLPEDSQDDLGQLEDQTGEEQRHANALDSRIQYNLDKLLAIKEREELEEVYGIAPIKIPVFVLCLQCFDSIILSVGLTLLVSSAYLCSSLSLPVADGNIVRYPVISHQPFAIIFPVVVFVHWALSSLYTPMVLPRIGVHTAAYVSVLVSLMCFFTGLAIWGALS